MLDQGEIKVQVRGNKEQEGGARSEASSWSEVTASYCKVLWLTTLSSRRIARHRPGAMMMHSGALIHAVGSDKYRRRESVFEANSSRMTLQGFSCHCGGKLVFFS